MLTECFTMKHGFLRSLAESPEGGEDLGKREREKKVSEWTMEQKGFYSRF